MTTDHDHPADARDDAHPIVSVVLVNYRGVDDTVRCLDALRELDWPRDRLEVVVVDNASGDGSVERLRADFPEVQVLELDENVGFADGCNRGVAVTHGRYVGFVNNDARPDPGWIREAVAAFARDDSIACVASKILDWEGNTVDFVDAALAFYGHGFKLHAGEPDNPAYDHGHDVLFASGAGMVVDADVFRQVGGFDGRYFMFFEDVDLGWRLWLLGHRVRYVPSSLVYHRHHATMNQYGKWREQYLLERNALFTIYKNYDDDNVQRLLAPALLIAARRCLEYGGDDPHALDLQRHPGGAGEDEAQDRIEVDKQTLVPAYAMHAFVDELRGLHVSRLAIQEARQRSDAEISRMFGLALFPNVGSPEFLAGFSAVTDTLGVAPVFSSRRRVLVLTGDTLSARMAGPAIRAWQIARALSREHEVVLASTNPVDLTDPDFTIREATGDQIRELERWCDVVIFQGLLMRQYPVLRDSSKVIVVDIYDPFHLEQLEQGRDLTPREREDVVRMCTEVINEQLLRGDYFMCASEKQRDFWLGQLAAVGRVNPRTYDVDESLGALVSVVPFGVGDDPPRHTRSVLKGVVPGIGPDDKVILWGGGIYNWFDPLTLLRAVDKLRARLPEVRLYFLGLKHPNPDVPEMRMAVATQALADELGLTGTHVFFNEGWVEYDDRQNFLLESDVGVSTHYDHVETQFSFRTRILDYLWTSLPVVATGGDSLGAILEQSGAGLTVRAEDVDALEDALFRMLTDAALAERARVGCRQLAEELRWARVLEPLVEFCRAPRRAPDTRARRLALGLRGLQPPPRPWSQRVLTRLYARGATGRLLAAIDRDLRVVAAYAREGEIRELTARMTDRAKRSIDQRRS